MMLFLFLKRLKEGRKINRSLLAREGDNKGKTCYACEPLVGRGERKQVEARLLAKLRPQECVTQVSAASLFKAPNSPSLGGWSLRLGKREKYMKSIFSP